MPQNTSSAVMQQRHEPDGSLDDFPTPPWATRALMEHVLFPTCHRGALTPQEAFRDLTVREPACGRGYMSRTLHEYFGAVLASDIHDYGENGRTFDYLVTPAPFSVCADWTITNPPFRLAEPFILRALESTRIGVAMLVRSAFLEGVGRYDRLFSKHRPNTIAQFTERVPMHRGRLDPKGSTATAYCWVVWIRDGFRPMNFMWIPPCRKQLERDSDYFWSGD